MTWNPERASVYSSYRMLVAVIAMLTLTFGFGTQSSMSSALVCMIDRDDQENQIDQGPANSSTAHLHLSSGNVSDPSDQKRNPWKFSWSYRERGWTLTYFFFPFYVMQAVVGTLLLPRFGIKNTLVFCLALMSLLQFLAVPSALLGLSWLYADRFLTGLATGPYYVCVVALIANWAPPLERSLLFGIAGVGSELGNVVSFAISSVSCASDVQGGWPFVFYIVGVCGLIMTALNFIFTSDLPSTNKRISPQEKAYMEMCFNCHQPSTQEAHYIPYKKIFTSLPVWANVMARLGTEYSFYMSITQTPIFLADVLKLSQSQVSFISGVPFLIIIPTVYLAGEFSVKLLTKGVLSNTGIRKMNDAIGKILASGMFLVQGYLPEKAFILAFIVNTLSAVGFAFCYLSYVANSADLSPSHAGLVTGIATTCSSWVTFAIPLIVVALTTERTRKQWQSTLFLAVGMQMVAGLFFTLFASGEIQPWARQEVKHKNGGMVSKGNLCDPVIEQIPRNHAGSRLSKYKQNSSYAVLYDSMDDKTPLLVNIKV